MLVSNGIQLPYGISSPETTGDIPPANETTKETMTEPTVTIDLTDLSRIEAEKWCGMPATTEIPPRYVEASSKTVQSFWTTVTAPQRVTTIASPGSRIISVTLSAQSAVDFVLE